MYGIIPQWLPSSSSLSCAVKSSRADRHEESYNGGYLPLLWLDIWSQGETVKIMVAYYRYRAIVIGLFLTSHQCYN